MSYIKIPRTFKFDLNIQIYLITYFNFIIIYFFKYKTFKTWV